MPENTTISKRLVALAVGVLVIGVVAIGVGATAIGVMVATKITEPRPAEARTEPIIAHAPDSIVPVAARLSLIEKQIELMNLGDTWDYEISQLLTCASDIDPNAEDYGQERRSWRAQIRHAGGAQTLGGFTPIGDGLHFIGREPVNGPGTVELGAGRAYEMRAQERNAGIATPWSEWSEWRSCGILLPRYPEQPTWLLPQP